MEACIPVFHKRQQLVVDDGEESFKESEYITIMVPGDSRESVTRPVEKADKDRWPEKYQAFVNNQPAPEDGMPIRHWNLQDSIADQLEGAGIKTVEQLASINENTPPRVPGILALKQKAAEYLKFRDRADSAESLEARVKELEAELDEARGETAALEAKVSELESELAAKPKRKKKATKKEA